MGGRATGATATASYVTPLSRSFLSALPCFCFLCFCETCVGLFAPPTAHDVYALGTAEGGTVRDEPISTALARLHE